MDMRTSSNKEVINLLIGLLLGTDLKCEDTFHRTMQNYIFTKEIFLTSVKSLVFHSEAILASSVPKLSEIVLSNSSRRAELDVISLASMSKLRMKKKNEREAKCRETKEVLKRHNSKNHENYHNTDITELEYEDSITIGREGGRGY